MEREFTRENLQRVYRMLFEMAKGNLAFQIERSNHHDELEGLMSLLNMTSEKLNKNRNQFLWYNRQNEVVVIKITSFVLNKNCDVLHYRSEMEGIEIGIASQNIVGESFKDLLAPDSRATWKEKIKHLSKQHQTFSMLPLKYKFHDHLHLTMHSVITRVCSPGTEIFIVTSALLDIKKDDVFNLQENEGVKNLSIWDQQLFQEIHEYIIQHLKEPLKPIYELAALFNTNEHKIKTGFKEVFGVTPFQYHREQRMEQSKILIANTDLSLKEIAVKMGFSSYPQFSRNFKNSTEMTPRSFKRRVGNSRELIQFLLV